MDLPAVHAALAAAAPTRYRVIDSSRPADQVARDVVAPPMSSGSANPFIAESTTT